MGWISIPASGSRESDEDESKRENDLDGVSYLEEFFGPGCGLLISAIKSK